MQNVAVVLLIADLSFLLLTLVPIVDVLLAPVDTLAWCAGKQKPALLRV